ncbi:hypothetical protein NXT3_PC00333 (plasmid) [Sinorhizobium fredii]|uniref:Uncharacterized protein n=1 Tax=Rhizobium fredii TaxID=380 RepID=A0A2L0HDI0_RHIFR|nr:hypothetical protein NXT3_PC00333 [Sinorhizobium fredii]
MVPHPSAAQVPNLLRVPVLSPGAGTRLLRVYFLPRYSITFSRLGPTARIASRALCRVEKKEPAWTVRGRASAAQLIDVTPALICLPEAVAEQARPKLFARASL